MSETDLSFYSYSVETSSGMSGLMDVYSPKFLFPEHDDELVSRPRSYKTLPSVHVYDMQTSTTSLKHSKLIPPTQVAVELIDTKKCLSEMFKVPQESVILHSDSETTINRIAVIVDRICPAKTLFLLKGLFCINVDEKMSVSEFIDIIAEECEGHEGQEKLCLFVQGRIVKSSTQKVVHLGLSNFTECKCIYQSPITIIFHYHVTSKIEILYYMDCLNTESVGETKYRFCQQFGNEFPIFRKNEEICFSYGTRILNNDDHLFVGDADVDCGFGRHVESIEHIGIHTINKDSIPIIASFNNIKKIFVTQQKPSTEELRNQIGKHIKKNPNSLKLQLNKTKIPDSVFPASLNSFKPYCEIDVKTINKKTFQINIEYPDGKISPQSVEMYKHDTVLQLKHLLASSIGEHPFCLQLCYRTSEMDDEKRLREYDIGNDGIMYVIIHQYRIEVVLKRPLTAAQHLVIDNYSKTTVLQMKRYVSATINTDMDASEMNIICNAKSLDNEQTLSEAGVRCNDTLFVCLFSHSKRMNPNGIFRLLSLDESGVVYSDNAVTCYGKKIIVLKDFEDLEEIPGTYQQPGLIPCSIKGIRLQNDKRNRDKTNVYAPLRYDNMGSDRQGSGLTQEIIPKTEPAATCSVLMCTQNTACQDTQVDDLHTSAVTPITTQLPSVTSLPPIPPSASAHTKSVYQTIMWRDKDGKVVASGSQQLHSTIPDLNMDQLIGLHQSVSLPNLQTDDHNSSIPMTLSSPQLSLQESSSTDELKPIFCLLSRELGSEWQKLGLHLGLDKTDIEKCEHEYEKNLEMQAQSMLWCWKKKRGKNASKEELITTLKQCNLNNIAENLEGCS